MPSTFSRMRQSISRGITKIRKPFRKKIQLKQKLSRTAILSMRENEIISGKTTSPELREQWRKRSESEMVKRFKVPQSQMIIIRKRARIRTMQAMEEYLKKNKTQMSPNIERILWQKFLRTELPPPKNPKEAELINKYIMLQTGKRN